MSEFVEAIENELQELEKENAALNMKRLAIRAEMIENQKRVSELVERLNAARKADRMSDQEKLELYKIIEAQGIGSKESVDGLGGVAKNG